MIKLHIFRGFEDERLGIQRETWLGHLYSDLSHAELVEAAELIGINPDHIQNNRGFYHFDLWGKPLIKARLLFRIVINREIYFDMKALALANNIE
jgi:hypothetical protein